MLGTTEFGEYRAYWTNAPGHRWRAGCSLGHEQPPNR
jgi:hypothetical protein